MATADLIELVREGLVLLMLVTLPPVGAAVASGLLVALIQTATQVQEATIGFAARAAAVLLVLLAMGPTIGSQLAAYTETVFDALATISRD